MCRLKYTYMQIKKYFQQKKCKHKYILIRDVHGDEINTYCQSVRSIWQCIYCGKIIYRRLLHEEYEVLK
jgi:hypothetical protein